MGENKVLTPAKVGARCDSRLCQNFANIQIFVVQIKSRSSQMMVSEIPRHQTAWIFPGTLQPGKGQRAVANCCCPRPCRPDWKPTGFLDQSARLVPQPSPGSTICTRPTGLVQSLVNLVQKPLDTIQKKPLSGSGKIRWRHSGGNLAAQNQPARDLPESGI